MNNNKMSKLLTTYLIALCSIINTSCSDKPSAIGVDSKQEPKQLQKQHYRKLPQSVFDELPFPANREQAKSAGFTNCNSRNEDEYTCSLNRTLKYNGYEFDSAYVELNTSYNLADYDKNAELNYSASNTEDDSSTPDEYSYRTIHIYTKLELDQTCFKENKAFVFSASEGCSTGELFLNKLENNGWLMKCEFGGIRRCAYYTKDGSFRIVNHGTVQNFAPVKLNSPVQLHLELEPLSPSRYGIDYKTAYDENESTKKSESKQQDFIKSMKN